MTQTERRDFNAAGGVKKSISQILLALRVEPAASDA